MSFLSRFVLALSLLILSAIPVSAVPPTGSAAWTTEGWTSIDATVYAGPGSRYGSLETVPAGSRIRVDRCTGIWCQIHTSRARGWVSLASINFGEGPWALFGEHPKLPVQVGAGPVCFYSGHNYTGAESCFGPGHVITDLKLAGLDNSFASVKVQGTSVLACRDRGFRSYCVVLNEDSPSIESLLNRGISSIHVY